jgi:hypothetical protein
MVTTANEKVVMLGLVSEGRLTISPAFSTPGSSAKPDSHPVGMLELIATPSRYSTAVS